MGEWRKLAIVAACLLGLPSFIVTIAIITPVLLNAIPKATPNEPIAFDHSVHVKKVGVECTFCHRTAETAANAGIPDVQQCMFCHQVVAQAKDPAQGMTLDATNTELGKIREAWYKQQPVNWERVHRVPDHVRFLHEAHVTTAKLPCETCHGDVANMGQVVPFRPLNMGDCLSCHKQLGAPTECATCHK